MTETQKIFLFCSVYGANKNQERNIFALKICKNNVLKVAGNKKGNFNPLILFPNVFTTAARKIHNESGLLWPYKLRRRGFYN